MLENVGDGSTNQGHRLNYLICVKICSKSHRKISSFFAFNCHSDHSASPNKNMRQNHGSTHEFPRSLMAESSVNLSRVALDRYGNHVMQKLVEPGKPRAGAVWTMGHCLDHELTLFWQCHWEFKQQQTIHGDFWGILARVISLNGDLRYFLEQLLMDWCEVWGINCRTHW